ncbi:STAS domain-containing protein [Cognaticolwellia mytili]|uniref:STAS domain-containing protein n=1 Tax=Cognaticolwellia mytili TaxID=1888913 RepID=UPI000A175A65|nr:STAS domain-containing protein [Cognaticolwellia mytili]
MTVKKMLENDDSKLSIVVDGKFDFSLYQNFRDAYIDFQGRNVDIVLDLSKTTYMDSSALGMILLLKEYGDKNSNRIVIKSPNETVNKILEIAQFHRLLTIEI